MPMTQQIPRAPQRRRLRSRHACHAITTSVSLPRTLHRRARSRAFALNWTTGELIRIAITDWLASHATRRRTA